MNACWQTGWNAHNAAVFPLWSQQLSALTDLLFLHSLIRGAHVMQKVNKQLIKVTCGWRKPPSQSSRPRSHCLYDSLSHVLAPRAIYLPLVFVFPASNVSFLLPLNRSVNFQKPVKSPHWPHGGGGGSKFKQFALVYSVHGSRNSAGGGKNTKASDPTSSSSLHMKKQTAFFFSFLQTATKTKLLPVKFQLRLILSFFYSSY